MSFYSRTHTHGSILHFPELSFDMLCSLISVLKLYILDMHDSSDLSYCMCVCVCVCVEGGGGKVGVVGGLH